MRARSRRSGTTGARGIAAVAVLAAGLALTAACRRGDGAGDTGAAGGGGATAAGTAAPDQRASSGATPSSPTPQGAAAASAGTAGAAGASGPLGDANIFALLEQANRAEVENGRLAERRAPSADVKAYARDMAREHGALQDRADQLARELAVIPQLPLNDAGGLAAAATQTTLGSVTGADFDRAYVAAEVDGHESTLQLLQRARRAAGRPELRALVDSAMPQVRAHLDRARKLQERVGVPTS